MRIGLWAWLVVGWLIGAGVAAAGEPAPTLFEVTTRDGQTRVGAVELGEGVLSIRPLGRAGVERGVLGEAVEVRASEVRSILRLSAAEAAVLLSPSEPEGRAVRGLLGEYFGDTELREWLFERVDSRINFEGRGEARPQLSLPGVPSSFSIRWTGMIVPPITGEYRFFVSSDDGSRVWVNDNVVSDHWGSRVIQDVSATMRLEAGKPVPIRVEYMDVGGGQFFRLEWEAKAEDGGEGFGRREVTSEVMVPPERVSEREWPGSERRGGWQGTYFSGLGMKEAFATQTEGSMVLEWGSSAPVAGMRTGGGAWSAVFEGRLFPPVAGKYRLRVEADDRVRLSVDDRVVVDAFQRREFANEVEVELPRDRAVRIRAEYENDMGDAYLRLRWRRPGTGDWQEIPISSVGLPEGDEVPPLVVVDRRSVPSRFFVSEAEGRELEARVWTAGGPAQRVEWVVGGRTLQTSEGTADGVVRMPLTKVPIGQHRVQVRVVDQAGRSATSGGVPIEAEGIEGGVLGGPWRDARVGSSPRLAGLRRTGDVLEVTGGMGDVELQADALRLVCHPQSVGQYVESALRRVTTEGDGYGVGGLMLRDSFDPNGRFVAVVLDNEGRLRVIQRVWAWQPTVSVPVAAGPGVGVRWVREADGVRLLVREGAAGAEEWRSVWFSPMRIETDGWGGLFAVSRTGRVVLEAEVPTVGVAEAPLSRVRGVMLTSGSFLAGESRLETPRDGGEPRLFMWHREREVRLALGQVAYIGFGPVSGTVWSSAVEQAPAVLMGTEDVIQGELTRLRDNRAEVDTVLFGPRSINMWGDDGRAVVLREFRRAGRDAVRLRLADGTVLVGTGIEVTAEGLRVAGAAVPGQVMPVRVGELAEREWASAGR